MKRLYGAVLLGIMLCASAFAQNSEVLSLGKLPQQFNLPGDDAVVRFTSHQKPEFAAPEYPARHLAKGLEGVVEVAVFVTAAGKVVYCELEISSGDPMFDAAALNSAMQSKFPAGYATLNGEATDFRISVPYYFLLAADPEQYWHTRLELARIQAEYDKLMTTFQGYLAQKTPVSKEQMQKTRETLETRVSTAKKLYRVMAEKKESAILRLRTEITETRQNIDDNDMMRDPNKRPLHASLRSCEVKVAIPQSGIVTLTSVCSDKPILEQLASEIELKKAYL